MTASIIFLGLVNILTPKSGEDVAQILRTMPSWFGVSSEKAVRDIELAASRIARCESKEIVRGVEIYLGTKHHDDLENQAPNSWSKVFVITRFVANIPADADYGDTLGADLSPFYRGPQDRALILWPWTLDNSGRLKLAGRTNSYEGPLFDPLSELQWAIGHFGRRNVVSRTSGASPLSGPQYIQDLKQPSRK